MSPQNSFCPLLRQLLPDESWKQLRDGITASLEAWQRGIMADPVRHPLPSCATTGSSGDHRDGHHLARQHQHKTGRHLG